MGLARGCIVLLAALAGLSALVWGVADFSGGKATQRADALRVVWLSKLVSLPLLGSCVALWSAQPEATAVGWGLLAGVFGTAGTVLFYRALSAGAMTVVAPVTSVTSAAIPVVVGLAGGERPPLVALTGVLCALLAVAFVSVAAPSSEARLPRTRLVGLAVGAGLGFALFMVCLAAAGRGTSADLGLWPLLASHVASLVLGGTLLALGRRRRPDVGTGTATGWPRRLPWVAAAGLLDTTGSATYLVAIRYGDLSLVAPIAALYPVTTVLLALVVEKERPRRCHVAGLVLAVAALHMVARPSG